MATLLLEGPWSSYSESTLFVPQEFCSRLCCYGIHVAMATEKYLFDQGG